MTFWQRYVQLYDKLMGRVPPLLFIPMWFVFVIGAFPYFVFFSGRWLIGFYDCSMCKGHFHVFTKPKHTEYLGQGICIDCGKKKLEDIENKKRV